jgi:large subunit ribosomal protein L25
MLSITVEKRNTGRNEVNFLRDNGKVPAVFYGAKQESTPVAINAIEFLKVWRKAGESSVIHLKDGDTEHEALIHEVVTDPVTDQVLHVDFYVVEKGKKLQVNIPLEFIGVSPAVKGGAILVKVLHEVEVEAKPADLPHNLSVDISTLVDTQSQILAKDIVLPAGVTLITKDTEVIALASEAKEEEVAPVVPVDFATAIEVEKKGKKDEEGAEEAPAEAK